VEKSSKYRNLAVRIKCINIGGSGFLFQPNTTDYSYVITAKHCLEGTEETPQCFGKKDIEIYSYIRNIELTVLDYYFHPDKEVDLVVIKIEYLEDIPGTLVTLPKEDKPVGIFGYPNVIDDNTGTIKKGQYVGCTSYFIYPETNEFEVNPNGEISNVNTVGETLVGLSGSGIFLESDQELYLMGIFIELKEVKGSFYALMGYNINVINQILNNNNLELLIPGELLDFQKYIETAFESNEGSIESVLKRCAKSIIDLSPNDIVVSHNEKLYLPYNKFVEEELLNSQLWEGWVSLLTYYYMDTSQLPKKEEFILKRNNTIKQQHNIKMFFTKHKKLSTCVMDLFSNNYDDLESNDLIVINTKNSSPGTKSYNKDSTKNVLREIDKGKKEKIYEETGIDIDDPDISKDVEFIHINLFQDEFAEYRNLNVKKELEIKLKEKIKEVFNSVP